MSLRVRARPDAAVECVPLGHTATGFRELESSVLELDGEHWQLEIDDEPLAVEHHAGCSRWLWKPGFFAGEVRGRLLDRRSGEAHGLRFDVSPTPSKLGRERFAALLAELRREQPQFVLGSEPARERMGSLAHLDDPLLAYAKLHAHAHEFLVSLARVLTDPVRRLRQERRMLAPAQIRRSDPRTVLAALRTPQLAALLGGCDDPPSEGREVLLDAPVVEPHVDEPANRCMKAMAIAVFRRVIDCRERLASRVAREKEAGTRTTLAARWPPREAFLQDLELRVRRMLRNPVLRAVSRAEITAAGLNTIAAHPVYARSYQLGWRCLGLGFEGEVPDEELWLPPTWELYERWCFVAIRGIMRELGFEAMEGTRGPADHAWSGVDARGWRVWLGFQVKCATWSQTPAPAFRSLSSTRYPDLVLTFQHDETARWIVLDAKYRASRAAVVDAMTSAHLYHDALRWHGRPPELSLLLVPAGEGAPWLEDRAFHDEHRVGVVVAGPGQRDELSRVLASLAR